MAWKGRICPLLFFSFSFLPFRCDNHAVSIWVWPLNIISISVCMSLISTVGIESKYDIQFNCSSFCTLHLNVNTFLFLDKKVNLLKKVWMGKNVFCKLLWMIVWDHSWSKQNTWHQSKLFTDPKHTFQCIANSSKYVIYWINTINKSNYIWL